MEIYEDVYGKDVYLLQSATPLSETGHRMNRRLRIRGATRHEPAETNTIAKYISSGTTEFPAS
jgi:hypothetical protein